MSPVLRRLLGLGLPALAACALDNTLTLVVQSPEYWSGNYAAVNEGSPTYNQLLQIHPATFIAGSLVWAAIFLGIIVLLPHTLALIVSIAVTFGHSAGAATWLLWRFGYGYQMCNALFLLMATALGLGIRFAWHSGPAEPYILGRWTTRQRWILAALLFAVGAYLYLWPRKL
jgi:hypothetical protein